MLVYRLSADLIVVLHCAFVAFVVLGLAAIMLGLVLRWRWVRNVYFRAIHMLCIGIVVLQAWLGVLCPLTQLENWLRGHAGEATYPGSFVGYWAHELLFFEAEPWVFTVAYSLFGMCVVAAFVFGPPRRSSASAPDSHS